MNSASIQPPRTRTLFTADWRFHLGDSPNAGQSLSYEALRSLLLPVGDGFREVASRSAEIEAPTTLFADPAYNHSTWRSLDLPHDWGVEGDFDLDLPGGTGKLPWHGIGWYRKTFTLPELAAHEHGRRQILEIDGAMSYSTVWVNGALAGGWPFGYASYQLDLTDHLRPGESNTIAIRLDNPPDSSRWYPGGGIYRNVWLTNVASVRVAQWGTAVRTANVSAGSSAVEVDVDIVNDGEAHVTAQVTTRLFAVDGVDRREVGALAPREVAVAPRQTVKVTADTHLPQPRLWSPTDPYLHVAVTTISIGNEIVDEYETVFGIRDIAFHPEDGFHLNGERVQLRGVCMHHDLGALGTAYNVRAAQRQLEILAEMGVNAIRTSHNPPAPELLSLCDEMGLLVIDEFSDCWRQTKTPNDYGRLFDDWSEADLRALVRRDRNHPSVILWSIGNEIPEQSHPEGIEIGRRLSAIVDLEDETRQTTVAVNAVEAGYNGFESAMDVFGYNYKPHQYPIFREAHPEQALYGSETSSTVSTRGVYAFPVSTEQSEGAIGYQVSSYNFSAPPWATIPDVEFQAMEEFPAVAGEFVWTGFDYLGEPTPFNDDHTNVLNFHTDAERQRAAAELAELSSAPSRSSYFGIVDLAGFPKDRYYLYQAHWRPDLPMAHILPHWTWDRAGLITPVHVYTSGDEGELFLNGRSLGTRTRGAHEYRLRWDDVVYESGTLEVRVHKEGKPWATTSITTAGSAARIQVAVDRQEIAADGADLAFVTLTVVDEAGVTVPHIEHVLAFETAGPGSVIATDNGDPTDHTQFASLERRTLGGLALAIVRLDRGASEPVTVTVSSDGLIAAAVEIRPADPAFPAPIEGDR